MTEQQIKNQGRVRCEVYSRVVGYLRPVNQWNDGKKAEFQLRTLYDEALVSSERATKEVSKVSI